MKKKIGRDYFDDCGPTFFLEDGEGGTTTEFTAQEIADYERVWKEYDAWQRRLSDLYDAGQSQKPKHLGVDDEGRVWVLFPPTEPPKDGDETQGHS